MTESPDAGRSLGELAVFELRRAGRPPRIAPFVPVSLLDAHPFARAVREVVVRRLGQRTRVGRVRVVPIPSVRHAYAGTDIRRVCVRVPGIARPEIVEALHAQCTHGRALTATGDTDALGAFLDPARVWETITPLAIPPGHDPAWVRKVAQAAAGVPVAGVCLSRTPFEPGGDVADRYAAPLGVSGGCLWHVRLALERPRRGLVILGQDPGLGLMVGRRSSRASAPARAVTRS